jgi:hypothetical protein
LFHAQLRDRWLSWSMVALALTLVIGVPAGVAAIVAGRTLPARELRTR